MQNIIYLGMYSILAVQVLCETWRKVPFSAIITSPIYKAHGEKLPLKASTTYRLPMYVQQTCILI